VVYVEERSFLPTLGARRVASPEASEADKLAALYRTYGPIIYTRCRRILRDRAAAEDATQETFMRVQRHLQKAPDEGEALGWIYRIATNYCLNELRNQKSRPELRNELPEPSIPSSRSLEELMVDRDFAARLVARAPAKVGVVAWLHHVDGLDQAEVAGVLGISRRTVVNRLAAFSKNAHKFAQLTAP
jgi:RNA polymerase sigma-70 factor (ECF subfamily)